MGAPERYVVDVKTGDVLAGKYRVERILGVGGMGVVVAGGARRAGIAVCDGPGVTVSFANHLVSYYTTTQPDSPYVGCNRTGCNGSGCNLHVWVWLQP